MLEKEQFKPLLPETLYREIEDICKHFEAIQQEAVGLMQKSDNVSAAEEQLSTVLKSTEEATNTILDSATAIQTLVDDSSDEGKRKLVEHVTKIYEACGFQDLTGQRITKVLTHLAAVQERMKKLQEVMRPYVGTVVAENPEAAVPAGNLMNGPAMPSEAPSQADIDKLFG